MAARTDIKALIMNIQSSGDDFTPIQDYVIADVKNALTMLKEYVEYGDDTQMDRGLRAYTQLNAYLDVYKAKNHFDEVAEVSIKLAMNRVMSYAEDVLDFNLSKFSCSIGKPGNNYDEDDIVIARTLINENLDLLMKEEKELLEKDFENETVQRKLICVEKNISRLTSIYCQLHYSISAYEGQHFNETSKLHCKLAVDKALDRARIYFRSKNSHLA